MFKYVKSLSAHAAAPEILELPLESDFDINPGAVLFFDGSTLTTYTITPDQNQQKYYLLEKYVAGSGKRLIKVFRIKPGMLFEPTIIADVAANDTRMLGADNNNVSLISVLATEGHGARVVVGPADPGTTLVELEW